MCDTMVTVAPGRMLFAKSSDRDPNEVQLLSWHPARTHAPGETVRCTHLTIPQATATHAVVLSRPFWMWGAEMGANQHGVVIGNEEVFTDEPCADSGLTGMDLLRLALERAATAADAVSAIGALLEQHGQGGGCGHEHPRFRYHSSFLIADARGAFILETIGRRWLAHAVSGSTSISNALTLPALRRHRDRLRSWVAAADVRRACTRAAAARARSVADLFAALRDHGGRPRPRYRWHHGAMAAPACTPAACSPPRRPRPRGSRTSRRRARTTGSPPRPRPASRCSSRSPSTSRWSSARRRATATTAAASGGATSACTAA
jgi:dipeptidase